MGFQLPCCRRQHQHHSSHSSLSSSSFVVRMVALVVALAISSQFGLRWLVMKSSSSTSNTTTTTTKEMTAAAETSSSSSSSSPSSLPRMKWYGPNVTKCSLTALILDPRIPYLSANDIMYKKALESLGEYLPLPLHAVGNSNGTAVVCFVLQVSSCVMDMHLKQHPDNTRHDVPDAKRDWKAKLPDLIVANASSTITNVDDAVVRDAIVDNVYERAGPFFRRRMDMGHVRFTFVNHTQYNFDNCYTFYNPNRAYLNYRYHGHDEFLNTDSDFVLFFERDVVLCRPLSHPMLDEWRRYAYVGAPWPPRHVTSRRRREWYSSQGKGGGEYYQLVRNKTWNKYWGGNDNNDDDDDDELEALYDNHNPRPFPAGEEMFQHGCLVGNGGLSLRSRKWLRRAIRTCPHGIYSGLPKAWLRTTNCTVAMSEYQKKTRDWWDDVYFGQILLLIGAPVPHPFVAALFSSDGQLPDTVLGEEEKYRNSKNNDNKVKPTLLTEDEQDNLAAKYWGNHYIDNDHSNQNKNNNNATAAANAASISDESESEFRTLIRKEGHVVPIGLHKGWRASLRWNRKSMRARCKYYHGQS